MKLNLEDTCKEEGRLVYNKEKVPLCQFGGKCGHQLKYAEMSLELKDEQELNENTIYLPPCAYQIENKKRV